jgi:hypothetical protein
MTASAAGTAIKFQYIAKKNGAQTIAPRFHFQPFANFKSSNELILCSGSQFVRENRFKSSLFVLVVQKHYRNHAQRSFAGMALRYFALQILQKAVRKVI